MASQLVALDASWDDPVICHGPIGWHIGFAGWRGMYGYTLAGWGDRVKKNVHQFVKNQQSTGRITAYYANDSRYNMGEVLVDALLHYWLFTGDTAFFEEEGYDFVAGHLKFQENYIKVPGKALYENFLNAWNTDNKWSNGGPGSIATAYTWRAYAVMAQLATVLGKKEDALHYQKRADEIKKEMKEVLWDEAGGVYGEYRDLFGKERLHTAPDLSSVYTPIDVGMTDRMEGCQMLHYVDWAIDAIQMDGAEFKYSSNWLPEFYSSYGLYAQETLNLALAYFQAGQPQKGFAAYAACLIPLMKGKGAGPGASAHTMDKELENTGHIDFTDTSSMHIRAVVEGLFGIWKNSACKRLVIRPGFPKDWKQAEISMKGIGYRYEQIEGRDCFTITSEEALTVEMHLPLRGKMPESVTIDGKEVPFTVTEELCFAGNVEKSSSISVEWSEEESLRVWGPEEGMVGEAYTVSTNGELLEILDPQKILEESSRVVLRLGKKSGRHMLFTKVKKGNAVAVLPVYLYIREKEAESQTNGGEQQYTPVDLKGYVNQNLRFLHAKEYDITWQGQTHYRLPKFYFCRDTERTVTASGRSWWEDLSRGKNGVPDELKLPKAGGLYVTKAGIPFNITVEGEEGRNAVFTSLYDQFPDSVEIPVGQRGSGMAFLLAVSTNNMQSRIENARITVEFQDGTEKILSLSNPENIDDWLCYQAARTNDWDSYETAKPYAQSGQIEWLSQKAHANLLTLKWGTEKEICRLKLECLSNEVLVGLLAVDVIKG